MLDIFAACRQWKHQDIPKVIAQFAPMREMSSGHAR
jgi:hypothetical protein